MRLSKRSDRLLRLTTALTLAFIYMPLLVIAIEAFSSSRTFAWPPPGFTLEWFEKALENGGARDALVYSLKTGGDCDRDRARARHPRLAGRRAVQRFFGRETISFLVILPIALPGIVTGIALNSTFTQVAGIDLNLFTIVVAHATFCIVVVFNNVVARLRRMSTSFEEASADLGATPWQTFRLVTLPEPENRARRGSAARLRALFRRDHRHHVHDRRRRRDTADLDPQQLLEAEPTADRQRRRPHRRSCSRSSLSISPTS